LISFIKLLKFTYDQFITNDKPSFKDKIRWIKFILKNLEISKLQKMVRLSLFHDGSVTKLIESTTMKKLLVQVYSH
jgi:hypothetical protein